MDRLKRTPVPGMPVPGCQDRGSTVGSLEITYTEPPSWKGEEMAKSRETRGS